MGIVHVKTSERKENAALTGPTDGLSRTKDEFHRVIWNEMNRSVGNYRADYTTTIAAASPPENRFKCLKRPQR